MSSSLSDEQREREKKSLGVFFNLAAFSSFFVLGIWVVLIIILFKRGFFEILIHIYLFIFDESLRSDRRGSFVIQIFAHVNFFIMKCLCCSEN